MNKTTLLTTSLLPLLASCVDLTGLDFSGLGGSFAGDGSEGWGTPSPPSIRGIVRVGPYPVTWNEATVLRFAADDTLNAVDSVAAGPDGYRLTLRSPTDPELCTSLVRARRWDGALTELVPLVDPPVPECTAGSYDAPRFAFDPYPPLGEPFTLAGQSLLEGQPVREGSVVTLLLRQDGRADQRVDVPVDGDGIYRYESVDQAVWFAACQNLDAEARILGVTYYASAGSTDLESCREGRVLPDLQRSSSIALQGRILLADDNTVWSPDDGTVEVRLTNKLDSTRIAVDKLLSEGWYHLWGPAHESPCRRGDVVTVLVDDRPVLRRHLGREDGPCDVEQDLIVDPAATVPTMVDSLRIHVDDPIADHTGPTDVSVMTLTFDPFEGDYTIRLMADAAAPFQDTLRVRISLYNPEAEASFDHLLVSVAFETPTNEMILRGWSDVLRAWRPGQEVYTNNLTGAPSPDGLPYRTSVSYFESGLMAGEDMIAFRDPATPVVVEQAR